jgi:hypothetical protein
MMRKWGTGKDVKGNGRGLVSGIILEYAWEERGKPPKPLARVSQPRFESVTFRIQIRNVTAWVKFLHETSENSNKLAILYLLWERGCVIVS